MSTAEAPSPAQAKARQRAARFTSIGSPLQLAMSAAGPEPAYYIFNSTVPDGGFVIVAGSDSVAQAMGQGGVLAFSDKGELQPGNLPPALADWLDCCEARLSLCRQQNRAPALRRSADDTYIAPMLTTKWGQRNPYNHLAPEYAEWANCSAGCLAVAMAQILKYWASDTPCKEIPAYTTESLGIALEALPATTFRYDMMKDSCQATQFPNDSTLEVARLMRYCGQAAEMDYDVNSGANTSGEYLARYFGFSGDYTDKYHATHMTGWEDLLYRELSEGRPMLYSGKKYNGSGHVFVVDGYKDGYFHINWGWDGSSNGFFGITLANPDDPDSAYLWEGYRWMQMAVIGLRPESTTAVEMTEMTPATISPSVYYDLNGRRVDHPRKGIYIKDNRKVSIK